MTPLQEEKILVSQHAVFMRGSAQERLGEASPAQLPVASRETITVLHNNLKQISDVVEREPVRPSLLQPFSA